MNFTDPITGDPINTPCSQTDGEMWFSNDVGDQQRAKRICSTCPAVKLCLKAALDHEAAHGMGFRHGIWGAMNPSERSRLTDRKAVA